MLITLHKLNSDIHTGGWMEIDVNSDTIAWTEDDHSNGGSIVHFAYSASNASTGSGGAGIIVKETRAEIRALVHPLLTVEGSSLGGWPDGTIISNSAEATQTG
jgi:hypothetical protein